ncbi:MAG: hypothetical protein R2880_13550 [Deinococcales bacterium]
MGITNLYGGNYLSPQYRPRRNRLDSDLIKRIGRATANWWQLGSGGILPQR